MTAHLNKAVLELGDNHLETSEQVYYLRQPDGLIRVLWLDYKPLKQFNYQVTEKQPDVFDAKSTAEDITFYVRRKDLAVANPQFHNL